MLNNFLHSSSNNALFIFTFDLFLSAMQQCPNAFRKCKIIHESHPVEIASFIFTQVIFNIDVCRKINIFLYSFFF